MTGFRSTPASPAENVTTWGSRSPLRMRERERRVDAGGAVGRVTDGGRCDKVELHVLRAAVPRALPHLRRCPLLSLRQET